MSKAPRIILKVLTAAVLVVIILLLLAWWQIDRIARTAVTEGTSYALGVPATLDKANVSLLKGHIALDKLVIANPEGFKTSHLLSLDQLDLQVEGSSLLSDTINVPLLVLAGLDVNLEQANGQNNFSVIMDRLKQLSGDSADSQDTSDGKKFMVNHLLLKDIKAHITLPIIGMQTVTVPVIDIKNLTQDNANGLVLSELAGRIVPIIMASVVSSAGDIIPSDLAGTLSGGLGNLTNVLGSNASQLMGQVQSNVGKALQNVGSEAAKTLEDAGGQVGEKAKEGLEQGVKGIGEGLNNLFGGNKDKSDESKE